MSGSSYLQRICFVCVLVLVASAGSVSRAGEKASGPEPESKQGIREEIRELYEKARERGERVPGDLAEWIKQEVQKIGAWEYKIVVLQGREDARIEEELNDLGQSRWECYWVERDGRRIRLFLKRPPKSYLRRIPVRELLKLF